VTKERALKQKFYNLRLDERQRYLLRMLADATGQTQAAVVRQLIEEEALKESVDLLVDAES
jgi:predicted DNA-binding protein